MPRPDALDLMTLLWSGDVELNDGDGGFGMGGLMGGGNGCGVVARSSGG